MRRQSPVAWSVLTALTALALAATATVTHPFTWPAQALVVGGALWLGVVGAMDRRLGAPASGPPAMPSPRTAFGPARWVPWAAVLAAAIVWECFCYLSAPRAAHPTISSLLDRIDAYPIGHGLVFAGWLWLGWAAVRT